MWRVFFTSAVVAVVVRSAMGWCKSGNCGHFGSGGFIIWDISGLESNFFYHIVFAFAYSNHLCCLPVLTIAKLSHSGQEDYSFQELLPMAIIGVIGGLLGRCFMSFCACSIFEFVQE